MLPFPLFPVIEPMIIGFKILGAAIAGEVGNLVTKDVARSIYNILKYLFILILIVIFSFLKALFFDFFVNTVKYWKKDFS
ncbi:MAG: hypothetical protein KKA79_07530 [Nanoarchaeota archaeon]|nr:hypothetical protein [Nanoarchaeota archaeon]MCG2717990.1 hypothetical protein [Nanoarchaeota archaeon]